MFASGGGGGITLNQNVLQAMAAIQGQQYQQNQSALAMAASGMQQGGGGGNPWAQQAPLVQTPLGPMKRAPTGDAGIVGLCAVTTKALAPVAHMDPEWTHDEMAWKVCGYIGKAAAKYWNGEDDRMGCKQAVAKGQAIIEEFVESCMHGIAAGCAEKPWFTEANLADPLFHAVMGTFENKNTTFMCRTLKPVVQKTVEDAVARYREEERVQKGLWEAVTISGLPEAYQKNAFKHLQNSFDRAHMGAPYGTTTGDSVEMGLVQDFVKGWMSEFAGRAWTVLNEGVSADQEEQYAFLTTLFQHLTDPEQCCLPFELVSQPGAMPPESWSFVADAAMQILKGEDQEEEPKKKKRKTGGGGGGAWAGDGGKGEKGFGKDWGKYGKGKW